MKVVLLAGGLGTRLSEETLIKPKPMVEIGGYPILWHIMKTYSAHGFNEFVICAGYRGYYIKEYFANYFLHMSDVTFDMKENKMEVHEKRSEPWRVTIVDTGEDSMTGGRLKRVKSYLGNETFLMTYGDGVGNVDIGASLDFHKKHGGLATLTAVQPSGRFGALTLNDSRIEHFQEKPQGDGGWINGGYFVLEPKVLDYIDSDSCIWEKGPMEKLAHDQQLHAFMHEGFWQPMDTLRDKIKLEELWDSGQAPWKIWQESQKNGI